MDIKGRRVAVVGGGITGLALALKLQRAGNDVVVFEASATPGGKIGTIYKDGFELDLGPITCSETPALRELISSLDLDNEVVTASGASSVRYIYSRNQLHRVEPGPVKMMTGSLLSAKGKLAFWKFPFAGKVKDETVASYARRKFGDEAYQRLFNPLMNGIYAGNSEKLSVVHTLKNNRGPRKIMSLRGGFGKLINAVETQLSIKKLSTVKSISSTGRLCFEGGSDIFDHIYLTTPSFVTAGLIPELNFLNKIHYSSVSQIYCEVIQGEKKFDGFGFLVPSEERMSLLGAVCVSNLFPQKTPDGRILYVLFAGGDRPYDFHATGHAAVGEFNKIIKPALTKVLHVQEWKHAIPQFYVGHGEVIEKVKAFEKHNPNICIRGNYISGVAVGECI